MFIDLREQGGREGARERSTEWWPPPYADQGLSSPRRRGKPAIQACVLAGNGTHDASVTGRHSHHGATLAGAEPRTFWCMG